MKLKLFQNFEFGKFSPFIQKRLRHAPVVESTLLERHKVVIDLTDALVLGWFLLRQLIEDGDVFLFSKKSVQRYSVTLQLQELCSRIQVIFHIANSHLERVQFILTIFGDWLPDEEVHIRIDLRTWNKHDAFISVWQTTAQSPLDHQNSLLL